MSKIALVHELQHIEDLASSWHPGRSMSSVIQANLKKGTLKKMEERAFGAQYDFIRDTFTQKDLIALTKHIDPHAGVQHASNTFKMANIPHGLPKDCVDLLSCEKEKEKVLRATGRILDALFLKDIGAALTQTKEEYVERYLSSKTYQTSFASSDAAADSLQKTLPFHAFFIGIATLGGTVSKKLWMDQKREKSHPTPKKLRPSIRPQ